MFKHYFGSENSIATLHQIGKFFIFAEAAISLLAGACHAERQSARGDVALAPSQRSSNSLEYMALNRYICCTLPGEDLCQWRIKPDCESVTNIESYSTISPTTTSGFYMQPYTTYSTCVLRAVF